MKSMKRLNLVLIGFCLLAFVFTFAVIASEYRIGLKERTIRSATVLTTDFVSTSAYKVKDSNQLQLLAAFTLGSSSSCEIKIEFSQDLIVWYQENSISVSSGKVTHDLYVHELPAGGNYHISVPILTSWYKVSAKALTDATGTSLSVVAVTGEI